MSLNNRKILFQLFLLLVLLLSGIGCSNNDTSGTGSHAGNCKVIAKVVYADSSNAVEVKVYIRKSNYLKDIDNVETEEFLLTDSDGSFCNEFVDEDFYTIEATDEKGYSLASRCTTIIGFSDTINLGTLILQKDAFFYGNIDVTEIDSHKRTYVQIYGLNKVSEADSLGNFIIKDIPAGEHLLKIKTEDNSYTSLDNYEFSIKPDDTLNAGGLVFPEYFWKDTSVIRGILDINGLVSLPVDSVVKRGEDGRINELLLSNKNLDTLTPSIRTLHLTRLEIANNNLNWIPDQVKDIISLKYVDASGNNINLLPPSFPFLTNIEYLNVDDNVLYEIHPNIGIMESLEYFSCSGNDLTTLPGSIEKFENLKILNISNNKMDKLPFEILNLNTLEYVDVRYNKLVNQPSEISSWLDANSNVANWRDTQVR